MVEHKDSKYTIEESTGMVHEDSSVDYATSPKFRFDEATEHHVSMTFDVPGTTDVESFRQMMMSYAQSLVKGNGDRGRRVLTEEEFEAGLLEIPSLDDDEELPNPMSLEEAISQGCVDLETFSKEMHEYIDQLCDEYDIK